MYIASNNHICLFFNKLWYNKCTDIIRLRKRLLNNLYNRLSNIMILIHTGFDFQNNQ